MKAKLLALAVGAVLSFSAVAGPATTMPKGPLYMKFNGLEQVAFGGASTWGANASLGASVGTQVADINANGGTAGLGGTHDGEISWGVFVMSTISKGFVAVPNQDIGDTGTQIFANDVLPGNSQITGMFYGIEQGVLSAGCADSDANTACSNPFPGVSGYLDLYWRDLNTWSQTSNFPDEDIPSLGSTPAVRTAYDKSTGYTDGDLLVRLKFSTGMDGSTNTIRGTSEVNSSGFTGTAYSYAEVIADGGGLWSGRMNGNYFKPLVDSLPVLRDFKFENKYTYHAAWDGGIGIAGATLNDPAQAYALPEPGMLSLMGLAMLGMAVARRRKS